MDINPSACTVVRVKDLLRLSKRSASAKKASPAVLPSVASPRSSMDDVNRAPNAKRELISNGEQNLCEPDR